MRALGSYRGREQSPVASYTWLVDLRPPLPRIVAHPGDPTSARSAAFTFADGDPDDRFQCRIDAHPWQACVSPRIYRGLGVGEHRFRVRALDPPAPASPVARFDWHVVGAQQSVEDFSIGGGEIVGGPLFPGAPPQAIRVTITNPNAVPIFVTAVTVTVPGGPAGCDSATNLSLVQSDVSGAAPIEIQAHGSVTLPAQGRSAPTIQLRDLPVNQDACQNARFPLAFAGSGHS
ncbi:MAG TPA: hypothetical protein VID29_08530 [Solirubrobacteraceae bacterium]